MGKGFDVFMENRFWRRIYKDAPSERLKAYYKLRFDMSRFVTGPEYRDREAEVKLKTLVLNIQDIQYIKNHTGSPTARRFYDGVIGRLSGEHEGYGFPASVLLVEEWNP